MHPPLPVARPAMTSIMASVMTSMTRRRQRSLRIGLLWLAGLGVMTGSANALALAEPLPAAPLPTPTSSVPSAQSAQSAPLPAAAQALRTRSLAASCAQCHGTDGQSVAGSLLPALAGMAAPALQAQMLAFRDGSRPASVMTQLARGFSDAQIEQLADFFAAQPPSTPAKDPS